MPGQVLQPVQEQKNDAVSPAVITPFPHIAV
jgi:hypothetical protein